MKLNRRDGWVRSNSPTTNLLFQEFIKISKQISKGTPPNFALSIK